MKKNGFMLFGLLASLGLLSACGRSTSQTMDQTTTHSSTTHTTVTEATESTCVTSWSSEKTEQLIDYVIHQWGPSMGQSYTYYSPAGHVNFYGVAVPDNLIYDQTIEADFAGETPDLIWSDSGTVETGQLALVAVFSDIENSGVQGQAHLYLFTMTAEGVPQVWITQQNQGNAEDKLYFTQTKNTELQQAFVDLAGE